VPEVKVREGDDGPAVTNGSVMVSVHLNRGTFSVAGADGKGSLTDAASSVVLSDGPSFSTRGVGLLFEGERPIRDWHGKGIALSFRREADEHEPEVLLSIMVYEGQPFTIVQTDVVNRGRSPIRVQAFHVLDRARAQLGSPTDWKFYKEGWQDWSPALVLPVSGEDVFMSPPVIAPATRPEAREGRFLSELMTVVASPSGDALLAGFTSTADQFSQLWLDREDGLLSAASYADGMTLPPGSRLSSEQLYIEPSSTPLASMARYGRALGGSSEAVPWPAPVSGWCSWYYYFQGVSEEAVLANLDVIASHGRELPFEYVQIDDGYQAEIGDWLTPNEKFPRGMGWIADQIHERGLKAGLWLAPFLMGEKSRLWAEHPDWAVQYEAGRPHVAMLNWEQRCYAIDLTRPEVIDWLEGVFRAIFDQWGYDYVKIDFVYAGAVDGLRHDPDLTRAQAYRRGIETIREVAGERFILGCGQPIGPSIGIVNGARIGPDVAPYWHPVARSDERDNMSSVSTRNAIRNILSRFWMHGSLWLNDPDCLLARAEETSLTEDEVRTLATVIALSGGMVLDSDNLARLSAERREIISLLLPAYGKSAVPLDLFEAEGMPRLFELDCETHRVLGVFNWADEPAAVKVALPDQGTHVFDVWQQRHRGALKESLSLELAAHGCALLRLTPVLERPQVVGSTFHLLQGTVEIAGEQWDADDLKVRLRPVAKAEGELFVADAGRGQARCDDPDVRLRQAEGGAWAFRLQVDTDRDLVLRFS
jgi:alpha-galactosidase